MHFGLCTLYYNICPIDLNELQALLHYDKTWDTHKTSAQDQDHQDCQVAKIDFRSRKTSQSLGTNDRRHTH